MSPRLAIPALVAVLITPPLAPSLASEPFDPFLGVYVGSAEAESQGDGPREVRDLDVIIGPTDRGFGIQSITVNHHGDRMAPDVRRRSSAMSFAESDIDGVYQRDFERDVFATRSETSVIDGDPLQWARVVGDTLLVYSFVLDDDGLYELHTYTRSLDETGLALGFTSEREGSIVRVVNGGLIRVDDMMDDINP